MTYLPGIQPPPSNVPSGRPNEPFLVDDRTNITEGFAAAGIVNRSQYLAQKRELENDVPWQASPMPRRLRKLTHFRAPGMGDAMWSGACVYDIAGVSPAYSYYDVPDVDVKDDNLTWRVTGGNLTGVGDQPVDAPTSTRRARLAAHYDNAPAGAFFQGYWNPHWSGLLSGFRPSVQPRPLHMNFNPGQVGSKELHRATEYKPVPPMGSIVGYFGEEKAL